MCESLSGMGVALHDDDYASMILMSLPKSYTLHLETLADAMSSSGNPLTAHGFIMKAIDLYEKRQLCAGCDTKPGGKDAAFQAADSKNKGKKAKEPKKDIECFICHKRGHFSHDCYGPGGGKEGQGPCSKKNGQKPGESSANLTNDAPNGTWSAILTGPIVKPPAGIPYDNDPYLEEVEEADNPHKHVIAHIAHAAQITHSANNHTPELYDSGATCHMTPLRDSLAEYRAINPKPISTTNQRTFNAIGHSNLMIKVPNGNTHSKILLWDILHTPDIAITLISIRLVSNAGYSVLFRDGMCTICN